MKLKMIFMLFSILCSSMLSSQTNDPVFTPFKGIVYKIPAREISKGYTSDVKDYRQIAEVEYPELNFPERQDSILLPGVPVSNAFGIVFTASMNIQQPGRYLFSLSSDDGSRLYIDRKAVINNDKLHKMRALQDTVYFKPGQYPVKIWFYQGVPDRYGLVFKATYLDEGTPPLEEAVPRTFVITDEQLKFAFNSYSIADADLSILDRLATQLGQQDFSKIIIRGHTDSRGAADYNLKLSLQRAKAIKAALAERLSNSEIEYIVEGLGEEEPLADNSTEEGRAQNRRVVVKVE